VQADYLAPVLEIALDGSSEALVGVVMVLAVESKGEDTNTHKDNKQFGAAETMFQCPHSIREQFQLAHSPYLVDLILLLSEAVG
jgi:hypothetical protein